MRYSDALVKQMENEIPSKRLIKQLRLSVGLSQAEAAEWVHLGSAIRWSEYERGIRIPDPARWELFVIKVGFKKGMDMKKIVGDPVRVSKFIKELADKSPYKTPEDVPPGTSLSEVLHLLPRLESTGPLREVKK